MTSNDKTGDQLVDSIRRTKAGATQKPVAKKVVAKKAVTKKVASKKKVSAAPAETPAVGAPELSPAKALAAQTSGGNGDAFQARRRVWPD